jgi:hypothetical protein
MRRTMMMIIQGGAIMVIEERTPRAEVTQAEITKKSEQVCVEAEEESAS